MQTTLYSFPFRFRELELDDEDLVDGRDDDGFDRIDAPLLRELDELLMRELVLGLLPLDRRAELLVRLGAVLGRALLRRLGVTVRVGRALLPRDGETLRFGPALLLREGDALRSVDCDAEPEVTTRRRALPLLDIPIGPRGVTRRAVGDSSSEDSSSDSREGVNRRDVGVPLGSMVALSPERGAVDVTRRPLLDRSLLLDSRGETRTRGEARRSPSVAAGGFDGGASDAVGARRRVGVGRSA